MHPLIPRKVVTGEIVPDEALVESSVVKNGTAIQLERGKWLVYIGLYQVRPSLEVALRDSVDLGSVDVAIQVKREEPVVRLAVIGLVD